jgi:hypothetical protein
MGAVVLLPIAVHAQLTPDEAKLRDSTAYLASDEMRGRAPGTEGYDKAAAYVVDRMKAAGLQPAGDNGSWYQQVPLVATRTIGTPEMSIGGQPMTSGTDFTTWPTPGLPELTLDAPVVFAGYGVVDAATGRNDYRGLDVVGKIVALFMNGPKGLNSEVSAHLGWWLDRMATAKAHGAVGVVFLYTKQFETAMPFGFMGSVLPGSQTTWADSKGIRAPWAPRIGVLNTAAADKLFAGYTASWDEVRAAEDAGKPVPLGPLNVRLKTGQGYETTKVNSPNVIGRLPGSDPKLAPETIVMTAHLDHVGTIAPVNGDDIANGLLDNAIGVALILEVARKFHVTGARPKRSILLVALTAEESGLTGSDYYTRHPTVPAKDIVANINLDNPMLTYPYQDLVLIGGERSSIGKAARTIIAADGLQMSRDPSPEQVVFTRSDHYNFVRIGVPSVFPRPGPKGPGLDAAKLVMSTRYHTPFDDMTLPLDWTAGQRFVTFNYTLAKTLADAPDRPRWVKGDYFGTLYKGPMAAK